MNSDNWDNWDCGGRGDLWTRGWTKLRERRQVRGDQGRQGRGTSRGPAGIAVAAGSQLQSGQEDFQDEHCPLVRKERYCRPAHSRPGTWPSPQGSWLMF